MPEIKWTKEQQSVIDLRNRDILVSAAAGSGKTAVLVERIINKITDAGHPVDIDRILVVTFTKAAAAEMKQRIAAAIDMRLEENPDNAQLKRQASLIQAAQITTIDSFCLSVVKNYFHTIELEPGYRVTDENECKIWQSNVMDALLEEKYQEASPAFIKFVESFAPGKNDDRLAEYVSRLYQFCISHPWPLLWLKEQKEQLDVQSVEQLEETGWVQALMEDTTTLLLEALRLAKQGSRLCSMETEGAPAAYAPALNSDVAMIEYLLSKKTYRERNNAFATLSFEKLGRILKKDGVDEELQEQVKALREQEKEVLKSLKSQFFFQDTQSMVDDMYHASFVMEELLSLTMEFYQRFQAEKQRRKAMDFSDIEHYALDILMSRNEGQEVVYSDVARELRQQYEEIMIDEYQDSNLVQELILSSISGEEENRPDRFMVGDVKQSIYKFRMARPELFMEKYHTYQPIQDGDSLYQRIDLQKNFRSRKVVLDSVNLIFKEIMQYGVGEIEYDEDAQLNEGASYPDTDEPVATYAECLVVDDLGETEETSQQLEARAVAQKIQSLCRTLSVWDKEQNTYRMAEPQDMVILLRTMTGWSEQFVQVLSGEGIPCYSETRTGYFSALEIQTVLNYLKLVDNPQQDTPMAAVLRSPIGGFTLDEMAKLRIGNREGSYAKAVYAYGEEDKGDALHGKVRAFLDMLETFRKKAEYLPVHELIEEILMETGYGAYAAVMPGGEQRSANLKALVARACAYEETGMKGLYSFNQYIEKMHKYEVDFGEAPLDEAGGAVRIMSIHKSKGLEFPVVFVCGMSKKFNEMDARASVVFHPDFGVASDYIDLDSRVKMPTLLKKYISHRLKLDNLGEELRVLYVALTRAKEKLILTGTCTDYEKAVKQWDAAGEGERLNYLTLTKAGCYLDWIGPVLRKQPPSSPIRLSEKTMEVQMAEEMESQLSMKEREQNFRLWLEEKPALDVPEDELYRAWECQKNEMESGQGMEQLPVKYSVSELKMNHMQELLEEEEQTEHLFLETENPGAPVPAFLKTEEKLTGAARGTVYHKVMELIFSPYCKEVPEGACAREYIAALKQADMLSKDEEACIRLKELDSFLESPVAREMWKALAKNRLSCEQPFVIGLPAREFEKLPEREDLVMVQGIIDVFWEDADGLVLLDYKTDHVKTAEELKNRYKTQLDFYKRALEQATGKKVVKCYIYSFSLSELVLAAV